ncbi:hypothetical protein [Actinoplanes sp. URMC 104]|uniref:hypothetical protein n=1 Tax=Actinoplanes sp. URMC 104 TaxID=3423409 RepID=UPI003F1D9B14
MKRGSGLWLLPVFLAVDLLALFSRGLQWQGEWAWTVDWANGGTVLLGPLLAGVVAYDVQRLGNPSANTATTASLRGPNVPLHVSVADWVWAAAAHALTLIGALTATALTSPSGSLPLLPLPLGFLALLAFAALGALTGTFIRSMIAAPLATIGCFALTYLGATGAVPKVFRVGGVTGTLVGLRYSVPVNAWITVVLIAVIAVTAVVVVYRRSVLTRSRQWVAGGLALALLVTGWVMLDVRGDYRFEPQRSAISFRCAGSAPQVCMAVGTTRPLPALAAAMHEQAAPLTALGISLPARYNQDVANVAPDPRAGIFYLAVEEVNAPQPDPVAIADYLSTPAPCPQFTSPDAPPEEALYARAILADVIRQKNNLPTGLLLEDKAKAWISSSAVTAWTKQTFNALSTCDLANVHVPF